MDDNEKTKPTEKKVRNEYTAQRAEWFNLPPQGENESDAAFRDRVSGAIRDKGKFIEAHEALHNCLYDDPTSGRDVMTGIMGAIAQERQGVDYGSRGSSQVGDDIAAGTVARTRRPDANAMLLAILLSEAGRK